MSNQLREVTNNDINVVKIENDSQEVAVGFPNYIILNGKCIVDGANRPVISSLYRDRHVVYVKVLVGTETLTSGRGSSGNDSERGVMAKSYFESQVKDILRKAIVQGFNIWV